MDSSCLTPCPSRCKAIHFLSAALQGGCCFGDRTSIDDRFQICMLKKFKFETTEVKIREKFYSAKMKCRRNAFRTKALTSRRKTALGVIACVRPHEVMTMSDPRELLTHELGDGFDGHVLAKANPAPHAARALAREETRALSLSPVTVSTTINTNQNKKEKPSLFQD